MQRVEQRGGCLAMSSFFWKIKTSNEEIFIFILLSFFLIGRWSEK
jgi:hypothetical protein